jgi:hypothetical protein
MGKVRVSLGSASIARLARKRSIVNLQRLFEEQKTPPTDWARVIREMRDARTSQGR